MLTPVLAAVLTFTMSGEATLRADGDRLVIESGARVVASAPVATTERVIVRGTADRDDTLTIDLAQPLHLSGGIDYDGGARGFDVLALRGGHTRTQRTTQLTPHDGTIDLDGLLIRYSNLEPITDTAPAASFTINGTAGLDTVTITDGPGGTTTVSSPTFESVTFANKTNVVYDGLGGGDTVQFNNPNPATGLVSFFLLNVDSVTQTGILRYPALGVLATTITLTNGANDVDRLESSADNTAFTDVDDVIVGNVSPALDGVTGNGNIVLTAPAITVEESVRTVSGQITLRASRLVIEPTGQVLATAPGAVAVETFGLATTIDLGSTTDAAPTALELSDAELDRFDAPTVSLETFLGVITVSQPITFDGALILRSPNWFTATGSGSLTAPVLTFEYTFGSPKTWTITPTSIQITGGAPIPYTATTLNARHAPNLLAPAGGNDTFIVTPSATTTINVDGNVPTPPATPGDTLDLELAGVVNPVLTATFGPAGYSGTLTSANRQPVNFSNIETIVDAPVDIAVTKTDNAVTDTAGTTVNYVITVTNSGAVNVAGATVSDTFPPQLTNVTWSCAASAGSTCSANGSGNLNDVVTIAANGSVTYTVNATIAPSAAAGTLTNTATVTTPAGYTETNPANNTSTDTTTIVTNASLIVTKETSSTPVPGGDITYTITLRNAGPSDAQDVILTDVLPAGTSFVSLAAPPAYNCTTGPTVTCSTDPLAPSATPDTFTLVVRVNPGTPAGTPIGNTVTATSATDPTAGSATATITVGAVPAGIPTLSEWMLMLFAGLLALVALRAARVLD